VLEGGILAEEEAEVEKSRQRGIIQFVGRPFLKEADERRRDANFLIVGKVIKRINPKAVVSRRQAFAVPAPRPMDAVGRLVRAGGDVVAKEHLAGASRDIGPVAEPCVEIRKIDTVAQGLSHSFLQQ